MVDRRVEQEGLAWQTRVWNRMSGVYVREIDHRFAPVVDALVYRAALSPGERVLDLGCGTGAAALRASRLTQPGGSVLGVDISAEMLGAARELARAVGAKNVTFQEGRGESIPAGDATCDVVLACLSLMFVIDRAAAACEIARVLRPGGRFVASVWAGADRCDLVRFQQIAGQFAGPPPVAGVGPGALADPGEMLGQLRAAGVRTTVELQTFGFEFDDLESAWETFAGVTAAQMTEDRRREAKAAILAEMYPGGDGPRHFRNDVQFIVGTR